MFDGSAGKLLVFASSSAPRENRLKPISMAAERMAKLLNTSVEIKRLKKRFTPIYVYYKSGDEEPIPIFCSNEDELDSQEVYSALRNMIFVLSFHPRHQALKHFRSEVMRFS